MKESLCWTENHNCANAICSSLKWIFSFLKKLQIEAKMQVILFRSEVLKYLEDHYSSGLLIVWMNDQQKICTFWHHKYPKILLPWVSQIFQRFEQAGLSLVCFLSLKAAKSLHLCTEHPLPWTLLTLRQAGSQGTLGNCWVTDPGFGALSRCPWLSDMWQEKCHQRENKRQAESWHCFTLL